MANLTAELSKPIDSFAEGEYQYLLLASKAEHFMPGFLATEITSRGVVLAQHGTDALGNQYVEKTVMLSYRAIEALNFPPLPESAPTQRERGLEEDLAVARRYARTVAAERAETEKQLRAVLDAMVSTEKELPEALWTVAARAMRYLETVNED
jgi:hypothetical protein